MNREQFVRAREPHWEKLSALLKRLEARRSWRRGGRETAALPALYREVCRDLSLAERRMYGAVLVERLNRLAMRGFHQLYKPRARFLGPLVHYIAVDFPRTVRANAALFWFCMLIFWGPFFGMIAASHVAPQWVYSVIGPDMAAQLDEMYGPDTTRVGRTVDAASNLEAFAGYIQNNIGIDFRTFAGGIVFGLGTLFFMIFNGLYLGAAFGHIHRAGHYENFYSFVAGHGSFELMAIIISGMAGLKIGLALVSPGRWTRAEALRVRGREGLHLLYGAALMTLTAAFIEGFWSPSGAAPQVKYIVGITLWVLVLAYFLFAGGRREAR
ncbi:MAG: stage II sporulation protein M [bacterium]|nr:stage II sporulation protein M [bacterium]